MIDAEISILVGDERKGPACAARSSGTQFPREEVRAPDQPGPIAKRQSAVTVPLKPPYTERYSPLLYF